MRRLVPYRTVQTLISNPPLWLREIGVRPSALPWRMNPSIHLGRVEFIVDSELTIAALRPSGSIVFSPRELKRLMIDYWFWLMILVAILRFSRICHAGFVLSSHAVIGIDCSLLLFLVPVSCGIKIQNSITVQVLVVREKYVAVREQRLHARAQVQ